MTHRCVVALMFVSIAVVVRFGAAPAGAAPTTTTTTASPVPAEFQATAAEMDAALTAALEALPSRPPRGAPPPIFAAELLTANGNQGPALLAPDAVAKNDILLDALQGLGAQGVTIDIPFPLLDPAYPRSAEYLAYYRQVVDDVRTRGMSILIETQVVFTGTPYSPLTIDYSAMPLDQYLSGRTQQTALIARELRPDYLAFATEQSTDAMLTGQLVSTDRYLQFVNDTIEAVGKVKGVKLGAGSGTWEDQEFVRAVIDDTDLDFVDLHIYPLEVAGTNLLTRTATLAADARKRGKEVVIGEAWAYKVSAAEIRAGIGFTTAYSRDALAFWTAIDAAFVRTVSTVARRTGVSFVSFYWAQFLFAYPDAGAATGADARTALQLANQAAAAAMRAGTSSPAGAAFTAAAKRRR